MKLHLPVLLRMAVLTCFSVVSVCTLYSGGIVAAADLTLAEADSLVVDYADSSSITDLSGGTLALAGGTELLLKNCGEGDGKTYTLLTGVSSLLDADGNSMTLTEENKAASLYFDTTQPGTGFWGGGWLQLTSEGHVQLVLHGEEVQEALTISTHQTGSKTYNYYEGICFRDITYTASSYGSIYSASGGAIYGRGSVTLSNNGSVTFSGNSASSWGGAIYGHAYSTISLSDNGSVTFSGNEAFGADGAGGAIYGNEYSTISLSDNGSVTFSGNSASSSGGAISGYSNSTITLSDNGSVEFSGNSASHGYFASGGAIDGDTILLSNNGSVTFSGNSASSYYTSGYDASGGAIDGDTIMLCNNGCVTFSGNTVSSSSYTPGYAASGGAIKTYGSVTMTDNGSVTFSGNKASGSDAYGGAIDTSGSLHIRNNDSVEFSGNVEKEGSAYRLRSVYVYGGSDDVLNISAAAGKTVSFHDSIYVGSDATVNLNADYEDAEGNIIEQKGDIVFTGATTEDDLYKAKGNVAGTEEEIRLSRTTEVNAMTNLYGGRLRVEDGAIYQGQGITVHEGSEATVRVKDATLSHSGYDLIFNAGTTLELEGANTITGNLNLMSGSSLVFENSGESGVTIHEGVLSIADDVCVDVRVDSSLWAEEYGETWDMVLLTTNATVEDGSVRYKISPLGETWGYSDVAWTDGTLAISFKKGAESALWQNTSGDYRWNTRSVNWMDGKYHFANVEGASVVLGQTGAGTITLEGAISIAGMSVETGSSYELVLAEGASLSVIGALNVAENSQLDMGFGLSLSSVDNRGDLSLADDLTVSGAITGGGSLSVQGAVSAASLQVGSLSVDSLTLTDATAQNTIGSSVSMAGAVAVAGGLSIDGSLSAASLEVDSLNATELCLTDAAASNTVNGDVYVRDSVEVVGNLTVGGHLSGKLVSVGGSLSAASLAADSLNSASLKLTDAGACNTVDGTVAVSGSVEVAGNLTVGGHLSGKLVSVGGSLASASLAADSLNSASLKLTDAGACNTVDGTVTVSGSVDVAGSLNTGELHLTGEDAAHTIGGAVTVGGAVDIAGSLAAGGALSGSVVNVGGSLSAASLAADSLNSASLKLTDAGACNTVDGTVSVSGSVDVAGSLNTGELHLTGEGAAHTIGGAVTVDGEVDIAGSLAAGGALSGSVVSVGGSLSAASLAAESLNSASLKLTDAGACNTVDGTVSVSGSVDVAGSLNTGELHLTGEDAAHTIGGAVTVGGAVDIAGSLAAGGALSGSVVSVGGSLTAASLQAGSLSVDSLTLTDAEAQNSIGSSVSFEGNAMVAGSLAVDGSFTAAAVSVDSDFTAASLEADSLVSGGAVALTAANAANTVSGDMTVDSVSLAAGATLEVGGVLTAGTVQMSGTATVLEAGSFGASEMDFVLDRAALENLGIAYGESATIARSGAALAAGYEALLNGSATESTDAAAYTYSIAVSGNEVKVEADYRWWDTRVWYRGAWVGEAEWEDLLIAGYDAVNGVETVDLGGESYSGYTLMVELEEGASAVSIANGSLKFDYIDMFAGDVNIGQNTTVQVAEMYGEGLKLGISGDKTTVTVSDYMQMGTVALDYARLTVADAEIGAITGTTGSLEITGDAQVTVDSDVTLSSLVNGGSLDMAGHALTVNGLTDEGGNVTAGEVIARSNMRTAATFDTLVADKVTVTNSNSNARYTDDLSVGDGSAIGELVAETLVVRDGSVMLGRTDAAAEMELLKLNLKQNATLVLNQQTELAVTDTLTATSKAVVQLKKDASICYGDTSISNRNESGTVDVNAYALSGKADLVLERAHVSTRSSSAKVVDYQLINSSVENAGTGTLQLTHAGNSLTSIAATSGSVEVYNQAELNLEHLSIGRNQSLAVMSSDVAAGVDEEFEARVNIFGSATFGADSTLIADLSIQSGATIRIEGVVHMGSSITLSSGMVLAGAALENALSLNVAGDYVVLFDGVDSLILDGETPLVYSPGGLTVDDKVLASKYFMGLEEMENLYITFEENSDSESGNSSGGEVRLTLGSEVIPEPTTSTLSLLALAALAARRRRK